MQSLPRSTVWHAQTPQFARYKDILDAHLVRSDNLKNFTDDASLLEASGIPIQIYQGDPENLKITTVQDLNTASAITERRHVDFPTTTKRWPKTWTCIDSATQPSSKISHETQQPRHHLRQRTHKTITHKLQSNYRGPPIKEAHAVSWTHVASALRNGAALL